METLRLTNGKVTFGLEVSPSARQGVVWIREFFSPYFWPVDTRETCFEVRLKDYGTLPESWSARVHKRIPIRASSAELFNLEGEEGELEDGSHLVLDRKKKTAYRFDYPRRWVELFISPHSRIHLFEFLRYVCLLVEESLGTVLLHASAAVFGDSCYLVLGNKGAGKTTTMFHLVCDRSMEYFSGDKVLLSWESDGLLLRGWPDYPHVGVGTLRRFPRLVERLGVDLSRPDGGPRPPSDKVLLEPVRFREAVPCSRRPAIRELAQILLPRVGDEAPSHQAVEAAGKSPELLEQFLEHPHEFGTLRWHRMLMERRRSCRADHREQLRRLTAVPWLVLRGRIEFPHAAGLDGRRSRS